MISVTATGCGIGISLWATTISASVNVPPGIFPHARKRSGPRKCSASVNERVQSKSDDETVLTILLLSVSSTCELVSVL